jgi:excisionase family DNA binding protein
MRKTGLSPAYVSIRSGADRAGVSTRTVKRWIVAGLLPAYRLPSRKGRGHLRIRLADLEALRYGAPKVNVAHLPHARRETC